MSTDPAQLSAIESLELFRSKQLSPVDLVNAVIARAEVVEPGINAFSDTFFEQAVIEARQSEARWMQGRPNGALDGLPVAIKDETDVAGQRNTEGSLLYKDNFRDQDAVHVARLRAAGAIFHARSTCPEFCTLWNTHSRLFGVTRNPWNLEVTPGGSSGGAGASLAACTSTLATGSDIGGSIRYPASQCGLVGFKPPYGRIPEPFMGLRQESYCANGPMARTVADAALMQNVMSGPYAGDAATMLPEVEIPTTFDTDLTGLRLVFSMNMGYLDIADDVARATIDAVNRLRELGAEVVEKDPDWPAGIERAYYGHMDELFYSGLSTYDDEQRELMCDYNLFYAEQAQKRRLENPLAFNKSSLIEAQMYEAFSQLLEGYDAFICPTNMSTDLAAGFNPAHDDYFIEGREIEWDLMLSTCHQFNMMGRCPALSVPSGFGDNGVPTGLQIVSTAYDDAIVFRVGAALESTNKAGVFLADIR